MQMVPCRLLDSQVGKTITNPMMPSSGPGKMSFFSMKTGWLMVHNLLQGKQSMKNSLATNEEI